VAAELVVAWLVVAVGANRCRVVQGHGRVVSAMRLVGAVAVLTLDSEELARVGFLLRPRFGLRVPSGDVAVAAAGEECFLGVDSVGEGGDVVECACRVVGFDSSSVGVGCLRPALVLCRVAYATELGALVLLGVGEES